MEPSATSITGFSGLWSWGSSASSSLVRRRGARLRIIITKIMESIMRLPRIWVV